MKMLWVAPTRFSSATMLCLALMVTALFSHGDASPLTAQDKIIAEQANALQKKTAQWNMPENVHYDAAQKQAEQVMEQIRQNPASQLTPHSKPKVAGRTVIFASMSLGQQTLEDILFTASTGEGVVVALRGVVDEKHFAKSIFQIQQLAVSFNGDRYLVLVTEILKNLCSLRRIGQCSAINILNQIAWSQPQCGKLFAVPAWIHTESLHLPRNVIGSRPNDIRQFRHVFGEDILDGLWPGRRTTDSGRIASDLC